MQHVLAGISQVVVTIGWRNIIPTDLWLWSAMRSANRSFSPKTNAVFCVDTWTPPQGFSLERASSVWLVQGLPGSLYTRGSAVSLIRVLRVYNRQGDLQHRKPTRLVGAVWSGSTQSRKESKKSYFRGFRQFFHSRVSLSRQSHRTFRLCLHKPVADACASVHNSISFMTGVSCYFTSKHFTSFVPPLIWLISRLYCKWHATPDSFISLIDSEIKQLILAASPQQFPHNPRDKEETTHAALCPQKNSVLIRGLHECPSPP